MAAYAQEVTLSELQSKGATVVAKDELATLAKGATLRWTSTTGLQTQIKLDEDGSMTGMARDPTRTGSGANYTGTWQIADDGKLCRAQVYRGKTDNYCWVISKMGDKYYYSYGKGAATELSISK